MIEGGEKHNILASNVKAAVHLLGTLLNIASSWCMNDCQVISAFESKHS